MAPSDSGQLYNKFSCLHRDKGCNNFVWQNGASCGQCIAKGRPPGRQRNAEGQSSSIDPAQIALPVFVSGLISYMPMDMRDSYRVVQQEKSIILDGGTTSTEDQRIRFSVQDPLETINL